jgi:hypothetical protein
MDLQAVEIEITIGHVEGIRAVLLFIPDFLHPQDQLIESRKPTVVIGAIGHMSYLGHFYLPITQGLQVYKSSRPR